MRIHDTHSYLFTKTRKRRIVKKPIKNNSSKTKKEESTSSEPQVRLDQKESKEKVEYVTVSVPCQEYNNLCDHL